MELMKPKGVGVLGLCTVAGCMALALGCAPDAFDNYDDFDAVITVRDPNYQFAGNQTYAMPNMVIDYSDRVENESERDTSLDSVILDQVADEMDALGYERIDDIDAPNVDVIVAVGGVAQENVTWGSYYSGVDPWNGYYWYYPVTTVVITYPVGTILIHMVDAEDVDTDAEEMSVAWAAAIRGLGLTRTGPEMRTMVSQAFEQSSEYLDVGTSANAFMGGDL